MSDERWIDHNLQGWILVSETKANAPSHGPNGCSVVMRDDADDLIVTDPRAARPVVVPLGVIRSLLDARKRRLRG